MTHRERMRAVLRGELPDRLPIVCRLDPWYRTRTALDDFPHEVAGRSLEQMQLDLGMGVSARITHNPREMSLQPHPSEDPTPRAQIFHMAHRMHRAGKWTAFHADSNLSSLLGHVLEAGYDVADYLATEPLVRCSFEKIRRSWGNKLTIWGGVPGTLLEPGFTDEQFRAHLESIRNEIAPGCNYIAGISDQAMPLATYDRVRQMADFFVKHGRCPLAARA